ncbi:membrane-bound lytic murein transglycosylase A [Escherichia coli]|nr:membrane-bound lytic murein transglycosylase A [Escherichia coli]
MGTVVAMLAACSSKPTDRGPQYKDGKFTQPFSLVNQPDAVCPPNNAGCFAGENNQNLNFAPPLSGIQKNGLKAGDKWGGGGGGTR